MFRTIVVPVDMTNRNRPALDMAARLLAPRSLERQCASCHGPEGVYRNSDYAPQGRILLEEVRAVRDLLASVPRLIRGVKDQARKKDLETKYEQALVPLREAVHSAHAFVFDQMRERLAAAKERSETLLTELANP